MRIGAISGYTARQNFKGIIAPIGGEKLKERVFGKEVKAYDEITDKKGFDVILLEHGSTRAFLIDKEGKRETYKTVMSDEPGDFNRRVKESICLTKAGDNMAVISEILTDNTAKERLGSGLPVALQNLTEVNRSSKVSNWKEALKEI